MQEYWSGLPFPSPGDLPNPGTESGSPALEADSLPTQLRGKHCICVSNVYFTKSNSWFHFVLEENKAWCN